MKYHACLLCENFGNPSKPVSLTTFGLYITFECCLADHVESKLYSGTPQPMIYNIEKNECWVDGSSAIPCTGCNNFKKSFLITDQALEKFKGI